MARVMRDATVQALAEKLINACELGRDRYVEDTTFYWNGVVKAWSVGSTRTLHDDDLNAVVVRIQAIEEGREEFNRRCHDAEGN